jgi:peptidoglycan/LPS O-acetylase OafA/YrhL
MFFYGVFAAALFLSKPRAITCMMLVLFGCVCLHYASVLPMPFAFWCDPIILEFCFGILVALVVQHANFSLRPDCIFVAACALGLWLASHYYSPANRFLAWGLPSASLVLAVAVSNALNKELALARPFVVLGDASYSVYLVHLLVIVVVGSGLSYLQVDARPWAGFYALLLIVASLVAAHFVYFCFERPMTVWLRRLRLTGRSQRRAHTA